VEYLLRGHLFVKESQTPILEVLAECETDEKGPVDETALNRM
jgi:hypothetical protein